jgi:hypothetical protein
MEVIDPMRRLFTTLILCCSGFALLCTAPARAGEHGELTIQPEILNIGTFYSGGEVTVSGEVPQGQDVIVEITGPASNGAFDVKGRVGPFWMTRGKAELDGAPSMYVLLLPGDQRWRQEAESMGLGLENLKKEMSIQAAEKSPDELFTMFLDLKKSEGLYIEENNAVSYAPAENGRRRFTATYRFPRSTAAGKYLIKATAVADGAKITELSRTFPVDEVGFTRLVDDLATHRRLTYGILAVAIALFTGAVMGLLFKGGGSH